MMEQIKKIPMTKEGKTLVKELKKAPAKAYLLAAIAARGKPDPREAGLKVALNNLFTEQTLDAVPRTPVALAAAVNSANEVVAALGSEPRIAGREEMIGNVSSFRRILTQAPDSTC